MAVHHESSSYVVCHDRNAHRYFKFMENPALLLNTVSMPQWRNRLRNRPLCKSSMEEPL